LRAFGFAHFQLKTKFKVKIKTTQAEAYATGGADPIHLFPGENEIMSTTPSPTTAASKTGSQSIGLYVELAGAGAFVAGAILSLHHYAIGACFVAGAAAFYVGKKMRSA
jgi:hypothetical protein